LDILNPELGAWESLNPRPAPELAAVATSPPITTLIANVAPAKAHGPPNSSTGHQPFTLVRFAPLNSSSSAQPPILLANPLWALTPRVQRDPAAPGDYDNPPAPRDFAAPPCHSLPSHARMHTFCYSSRSPQLTTALIATRLTSIHAMSGGSRDLRDPAT
jgi:hypothetical protein